MATQHSSYEPLCRFGHAAVAVGSEVHIWQGVGPKRNVQEGASTIEVFDVTTELWEQNSIRRTPPPGLSNTAYTVVGTSLYSFGGHDGKYLSNSLYQLDLHTVWSGRSWWSGILLVGHTECVAVGWCPMETTNSLSLLGEEMVGYSNEVHIFNLDKGEPKFQWELGSNVCTC